MSPAPSILKATPPGKPAPAIKAVGPLPPPIVPPPPVPKPPAPPPAAAVSLAPALVPNQGQMYAPIDVACPHQNADLTNCGAAENEPCVWQQSGMAGTFHAERIANAAAASRGSGIDPTDQQFDNAVLDSGLV